MNNRIIALVASLAVIIGLMTSGSSYAWFVTSTKKAQRIQVSLVSSLYSTFLTDLSGSDNIIIMQGDNLVNLDGKDAMLQIENKSTADTQVRIKIEYTSYKTGSAQQVVYSADKDDDITVTFADKTWSKNVNAADECYFYYMGNAYKSAEITSLDNLPSIGTDVKKIEAISSIVYKDDISYAYSGRKVNVKVTFETKQADNLTWSTVDSYNVSATTK